MALPRFLLLYSALYAAFGIISPFIPALLQERGLNSASIGLVLAAGTAVRLVSAPLAGRIADRFGALRLVLAVLAALSGLMTLLFLTAASAPFLLAVVILESAALAPVVPLSDALAVFAAKPNPGSQTPNFRYGWVRGAGSGAFICGSLVAGQMIAGYGLSSIVIAGAALLGAAALTALFVPEPRRGAAPSSLPPKADFRAALALFRIPIFRRLLIVAALVLGSHALHDSFAVIRWREVGIDSRTISVLWSESVAAEVLVFFVVGEPLLDRLGPAGAAALAAGAACIRWIVMGSTAAIPAMALVEPLHGLTFALLHLACMRVLAQTVPVGLAATAQAIYGAVGIGAASAVLTLASGELYELFAAHAFWLMAALSAIALPLTPGLRQPAPPANGGMPELDGEVA
ncbi:MAG: 3-phenylpropionate MFS transporter [Beijerinckiaceae bacterium]